MVYGRTSPFKMPFQITEDAMDSAALVLVDSDESIRQLKFNLHRAQQSMKKATHKHSWALTFEE